MTIFLQSGFTAVFYAVELPTPAILSALLRKGASPSAVIASEVAEQSINQSSLIQHFPQFYIIYEDFNGCDHDDDDDGDHVDVDDDAH